jgi:short-subunit dehydrogenase
MTTQGTSEGHEAGSRLAVVTGATAGIGHELARVFASEGFDVVIAAEDDRVETVATELRATGVQAHGVRVDLATREGCATLASEVAELERPVDALALNAGVGVSGPFLESGTIEDQLRVIDLDVAHVVHLAHRLLPAMVARGEGRVLITSSIVATVAAPYQATYSGSKAFLQSFGEALREEIKDSGVTVTALQPGGTDTEFWERSGANDQDTRVTDTTFEDPATVARDGFDGMMRGDDHVAPGRPMNAVLAKAGAILPDAVTAKLSSRLTKPGTSSKD